MNPSWHFSAPRWVPTPCSVLKRWKRAVDRHNALRVPPRARTSYVKGGVSRFRTNLLAGLTLKVVGVWETDLCEFGLFRKSLNQPKPSVDSIPIRGGWCSQIVIIQGCNRIGRMKVNDFGDFNGYQWFKSGDI